MLDKNILQTANRATAILKNNNISISCAESCTGGLFSAYLTSIPGISSVYEMGMTTYSNRIKHGVLGVCKKTIEENGAVSRNTAKEMAMRIRKISGSDIGMSVTGVAGPGSSEGKTPGTVYIALADSSQVYVEKLNINPISRDFIRHTAVDAMFELILKYAQKNGIK